MRDDFNTFFAKAAETYPVGKFDRKDFQQKMAHGAVWHHRDSGRAILNTSVTMYRLPQEFFRVILAERLIVKSTPMDQYVDIYAPVERTSK